MNLKGSGILLHITSLPSPYGIGDLGPCAYRFVDFLAAAGQRFWQILPVNPTGTVYGNAPYSGYSAFAGSPLLISPELLVEQGFLSSTDIEPQHTFPDESVDYRSVIQVKGKILKTAYEKFKDRIENDDQFQRFCHENSHWLDDYGLFVALKDHFHEVSWVDWQKDVRDREESAMNHWKTKLRNRIQQAKFYQYLFFIQWKVLKDYCRSKSIQVIGDIPIYVSNDSADAWSHQEIFKLDEEKRPIFVAGAPPDAFSATGQRWGNPVYRWDVLRKHHYSWWIKRMEHNLKLFDVVRLDHFRGFVAYWEVPATEETAINGKWVEAPAADFFTVLSRKFPSLPIIVEDLGVITPDVTAVMNHFGFPGMKILLFAFGGNVATNPYAPHNYTQNCVVYTGTHDNNTIQGWFKKEASEEDKKHFLEYLGKDSPGDNIHWDLIRIAMMSVADLVIIPLQDILGLGEEARMNLPNRAKGNWKWRVLPDQLSPTLAQKIKRTAWIYGRVS